MNRYNKAIQGGAGSGLGGALSLILAWMSSAFAGVEIPPDVQTAMTVLLGIAGGAVFPSFGRANA